MGVEDLGGRCLFSCDNDAHANKTYEVNFKEDSAGDITKTKASDIPDHDLLVAGYPCQAFSVAGRRLGFEDTRGTLFFDVARILKEKKPSTFLLENVKGLVNHDKGNTFKVMTDVLEDLGYHIHHTVLSPHTHANVPQNRERVFIVGFKKRRDFSFPKPKKLTVKWRSLLTPGEQDPKYYYRNEKSPSYERIKEGVTSFDSIYQYRRYYVRENKSGVCPALTANMGSGGHNVPLILDKWGIRKLTPRECARFQGFPEDYVLPEMPDSHLYHQIGNSVCVPLVRRIVERILE